MTDWLAAADRVAAVAAEHAVHGERLRRLPMPVVDAMRAEGVQRLCVPAAYGGPEVDPPTILQVIERIATADGAAGWCTMIATTTSLLSHYVEPDHARQIWGDPPTSPGRVRPQRHGNQGRRWVPGQWRMWGSGTSTASGSPAVPPATGSAGRCGSPGSGGVRRHVAHLRPAWHGQHRLPRGRRVLPRVWPLSRRSPVRRSIRHLALPDMTLLAVGVAAPASASAATH
jgi:hypothetical protein